MIKVKLSRDATPARFCGVLRQMFCDLAVRPKLLDYFFVYTLTRIYIFLYLNVHIFFTYVAFDNKLYFKRFIQTDYNVSRLIPCIVWTTSKYFSVYGDHRFIVSIIVLIQIIVACNYICILCKWAIALLKSSFCLVNLNYEFMF